LLHGDGKVPWKHFKDIPNGCLYNMDEIAMDTTQHKQKVIGDKQNRSRTFIITPWQNEPSCNCVSHIARGW